MMERQPNSHLAADGMIVKKDTKGIIAKSKN